MSFLALLLLLTSSYAQVSFGATQTLGSSDARLCYEESLIAISSSGLQYCNHAIKKDELTRRDLAATYSNRGIIHARIGKYSKALDDQNKALDLIPEMAEGYINRGNVYFSTRDYEKALLDYEKAIELDATPSSHTPWYNKGLTLIRLKRIDEARDAFKKALELAPESRRIRQRLDELETD